MKPKMIAKLSCVVLMTAVLLFLMAYDMVGEMVHEWLGVSIFLLFFCHHILNIRWSKHIFKGKYNIYRVFQTLISIALFGCMTGLAYSGVILSRHVFSFLSIQGGRSLARILHMFCSYWSFALIGMHLGIHWSMIIGIMYQGRKKSTTRTMFLRVAAIVIASYGLYAFFARKIETYMLLQSHFVFFDYDEPLLLFLLNYVAVMGTFVFIGHYLSKFFKWVDRKRKEI